MKKILMCPPQYYDIEYEINPWMHIEDQPDRKKAYEQWESLHNMFIKLGVDVEIINQQRGLPDMVFTANGGIVKDNVFVSANYRYQERKGEELFFQKWFADHGFTVKRLKNYQGGEGDALFYKNVLYMGYGFRSDIESHKEIGKILKVPTVSFQLIDPYFYDFDTAFCPMGDRGVLYYPFAYAEEDRKKVASLKNSIEMTRKQVEHFVGNSIYINGKLLVSFVDDNLKKKLAKLDIEPILLDMSEFKKSGGGIKCLTLYIT